MTRWIAVMSMLVLPAVAVAQEDGGANMNLVVSPASYGGCADFVDGDYPLCLDLTSSSVDDVAFVWVVASHQGGYAEGISGVQFGVTYSGVGVQAWGLCTGGSEIPDGTWPASDSGNAATWSGGCYSPPGEVAKVGYFTVDNGASGTIGVVVDPRINEIQFTDCLTNLFSICPENAAQTDLSVGSIPVCTDECGTVPVDGISWGSLKQFYN